MKYTIACRGLGGDCDFVATGATPTEAKRAFMRVELERQMDGLLDRRPR